MNRCVSLLEIDLKNSWLKLNYTGLQFQFAMTTIFRASGLLFSTVRAFPGLYNASNAVNIANNAVNRTCILSRFTCCNGRSFTFNSISHNDRYKLLQKLPEPVWKPLQRLTNSKSIANVTVHKNGSKALPVRKSALPKRSDISRLISLAKPERWRLLGKVELFVWAIPSIYILLFSICRQLLLMQNQVSCDVDMRDL